MNGARVFPVRRSSLVAAQYFSVSATRLILASASPRRRELLYEAGYDFEVHPADIDEDNYPSTMLPADLAERLAVLKAQAVAARFPDAMILAADTVVAFGDKPIGKADNADHARQILQLLSGTTHLIITGIAIKSQNLNLAKSARVMSAVRMKMLSDQEIDKYVQSGQWEGKAGAYGIQDGMVDPFIVRMTGSKTNIVGLPMEAVKRMLTSYGVEPVRDRS